jgi:hypothetical protein
MDRRIMKGVYGEKMEKDKKRIGGKERKRRKSGEELE